MVGYVESTLHPDEKVLYRAKLHWIIYVPGLVVAMFGFAMTASQEEYWETGRTLVVIGLVLILAQAIRQWTTEIVVTSRRIIWKIGLVSRQTFEMNLAQVESVILSQTVLGRLLNYGTVDVLGTGTHIEPLSQIDSPITLRNYIKEYDVPKANPAADRGSTGPQSLMFSEQGDNPYNEGEPISSNAEPSGEVGKPAASPAEPARSSLNSELEALEHLVKLRDVGALTDAEFQAAKKKILGG